MRVRGLRQKSSTSAQGEGATPTSQTSCPDTRVARREAFQSRMGILRSTLVVSSLGRAADTTGPPAVTHKEFLRTRPMARNHTRMVGVLMPRTLADRIPAFRACQVSTQALMAASVTLVG